MSKTSNSNADLRQFTNLKSKICSKSRKIINLSKIVEPTNFLNSFQSLFSSKISKRHNFFKKPHQNPPTFQSIFILIKKSSNSLTFQTNHYPIKKLHPPFNPSTKPLPSKFASLTHSQHTPKNYNYPPIQLILYHFGSKLLLSLTLSL